MIIRADIMIAKDVTMTAQTGIMNIGANITAGQQSIMNIKIRILVIREAKAVYRKAVISK